MDEKVILIDAVGCLVNSKGKINHKVKDLLKKFKNKKIVLTNANDSEKKLFLKNVPYETFSLKHSPDKKNPKYYKKLLLKYNFTPHQLVYFEHDISAVKSARSQGIITHHFDGNTNKLNFFLNLVLKKEQRYPKKDKLNFHYYPHQPVIIGVKEGKKINFMPCVWNTGLSYEPFLYGVSVRKKRYTNKMLKKAKSFSVNFMDFKNVNLIRSLGRSSGRQINKVEKFNINYSEGLRSGAPILTDSYLSFECKKKFQNTYGTHTLFVGQVELIHVANKISKKSILDITKVSPTLYLGADHYISVNKKSLLSLQSLPFHHSYLGKRIKLIK
jgi:flavin reductase (DIM6/NTAB) family NADH-FMN oxidoreductase RutF|tara:strand:+ start:90 stop:1073 length:984 start_codon:yes stop_codon:yes gene_type:complete